MKSHYLKIGEYGPKSLISDGLKKKVSLQKPYQIFNV